MESLPERKTEIYETLNELIMDRTTMKTFGCESSNVVNLESMLFTLGKFAWEALQDDIRQLLIRKVRECMRVGAGPREGTAIISSEPLSAGP